MNTSEEASSKVTGAVKMSQIRARDIWEEETEQKVVPVRYARTSVLLLGWEPYADDTAVATDVSHEVPSCLQTKTSQSDIPKLEGLQKVMRDRYKFQVTLKLMDCDTSPQQQAFQHLGNFVAANNKPDTLLIVYYAGHGSPSARNPSRIVLSGKRWFHPEDKVSQSIEWDEVEFVLRTTTSDVLVVFDCCQAGLLCRSAKGELANSNRIFQYLGACGPGEQTHRGGKHSFTNAMTWALAELAKESAFPVNQLVNKIREHKDFPQDQLPVLFSGRYNPVSENIHLAPIRSAKASTEMTGRKRENAPPIRSVIELRFHFAKEFGEDEIRKSARVLKHCIDERALPCQNMSFIDAYSLESNALAVEQRKAKTSTGASSRTATTRIDSQAAAEVAANTPAGLSQWFGGIVDEKLAACQADGSPRVLVASEIGWVVKMRGVMESFLITALGALLALSLYHWFSSLLID